MRVRNIELGIKTYEKLFQKSKTMIQDDIGDFFNFLIDLSNIKMTLLHNGVKTVKIVGSCTNLNSTICVKNYASYINEISNLLEFLDSDSSACALIWSE